MFVFPHTHSLLHIYGGKEVSFFCVLLSFIWLLSILFHVIDNAPPSMFELWLHMCICATFVVHTVSSITVPFSRNETSYNWNVHYSDQYGNLWLHVPSISRPQTEERSPDPPRMPKPPLPLSARVIRSSSSVGNSRSALHRASLHAPYSTAPDTLCYIHYISADP